MKIVTNRNDQYISAPGYWAAQNVFRVHNTMFREAFNRIQDTGSLKDWGITKDSKLYFDLSTPGKYFGELNNPEPPNSFRTERPN